MTNIDDVAPREPAPEQQAADGHGYTDNGTAPAWVTQLFGQTYDDSVLPAPPP